MMRPSSAQDAPPVLVLGSGAAGCLLALELAQAGRPVWLVAKAALDEANTRYAQGGMSVALAAPDAPEVHARDTFVAGAGLCDEAAVRVLTEEAPARFTELSTLGVHWDMADGHVALTLEGAHTYRRVVHANGDATGAEIERALLAQVRAHPLVTCWEDTFALDLLAVEGRCVGATLLVRTPSGLVKRHVPASAVVLATGGAGQLYAHTTNPAVATADGLAMAFRAGAELRDLEFIQFHPTALALEGAPSFLISEAVRGEGAVLRGADGDAFMAEQHPLKDLAPRDVVARAIARQMADDARPFVELDLRHLDPALVAQRFPTISQVLSHHGLSLPQDPIPVAPAAHYSCGGVVTDLDGRTSLAGLYAIGEVAWTGVHGANRLASNSLLECVVFGHRAARAILDAPASPVAGTPFDEALDAPLEALPAEWAAVRRELAALMWQDVGLMRDAAGLERACAQLTEWERALAPLVAARPSRALGELANMITAGRLVAAAASWRHESRGCHHRLDYPETDAAWKRHCTLSNSTMPPCPSTPS